MPIVRNEIVGKIISHYNDILKRYKEDLDDLRIHEIMKIAVWETAWELGYVPYPEYHVKLPHNTGRWIDMVWKRNGVIAIAFEIQDVNHQDTLKESLEKLNNPEFIHLVGRIPKTSIIFTDNGNLMTCDDGLSQR